MIQIENLSKVFRTSEVEIHLIEYPWSVGQSY